MLLVHYQGWPDHGVPTQTREIREILFSIRAWKKEQQLSEIQSGPTVVHCSAGCGRTGTFCVVDTALSVLESIRYPHLTSTFRNYTQVTGEEQQQAVVASADIYDWESERDIVFESLDSFRKERMLMVQTGVQYAFCYEAVRDLCE